MLASSSRTTLKRAHVAVTSNATRSLSSELLNTLKKSSKSRHGVQQHFTHSNNSEQVAGNNDMPHLQRLYSQVRFPMTRYPLPYRANRTLILPIHRPKDPTTEVT